MKYLRNCILVLIMLMFASTSSAQYPSSWNSGWDIETGIILMGNAYRPEYLETDQGATGNGKTAKAYIDTIGSDNATLFFRHNSGSATTTYQLSTDETIPSNVNVVIEKGAILSIDNTFGFLQVTVPNKRINGMLLINYVVSTGALKRIVTGQVRVSIARIEETSTKHAIDETIAQQGLDALGGEAITLTFALSANTGANGAEQTFNITVLCDSDQDSASMIKYDASIISGYWSNTTDTTHLDLTGL